jgi:hypothetical protein
MQAVIQQLEASLARSPTRQLAEQAQQDLPELGQQQQQASTQAGERSRWRLW